MRSPLDADAEPDVVEALRAAHALEREAVKRLEGLLSALDDAELQHVVMRHLHETEGHEAAVSARLEELDAAPRFLVDLLATARPQRPSGTPADMLRDAHAFERRECDTYGQLASTARAAGDGATVELAERIRADEEAMAETIASSLRRMGQSI